MYAHLQTSASKALLLSNIHVHTKPAFTDSKTSLLLQWRAHIQLRRFPTILYGCSSKQLKDWLVQSVRFFLKRNGPVAYKLTILMIWRLNMWCYFYVNFAAILHRLCIGCHGGVCGFCRLWGARIYCISKKCFSKWLKCMGQNIQKCCWSKVAHARTVLLKYSVWWA